MMKSAQDSVRTYDAGSLNRTRNRRIFVQGSVRSDAVVIIGVRFQNPAQMLLAEDDEVIQNYRRTGISFVRCGGVTNVSHR